MQKKIIGLILIFKILVSFSMYLNSSELPPPTYDNTLILSFSYPLSEAPSSEIDYIKSQFQNGLYAKLTFSSFVTIAMDWFTNPENANDGIQTFKYAIDKLVQKAKLHGVSIHLIMQLGFSRQVNTYKSAKEEDLRNAQWFNDNNIASQSQLQGYSETSIDEEEKILLDRRKDEDSLQSSVTTDDTINHYVFTTFSRYARKLRNHSNAKFRTAIDYLKLQQEKNPEISIIISVPGEAELNSLRLNPTPSLQEFFCDYSPYAILEFRDWIKHEGMYADGAIYSGQGYSNGGSRYQGTNGLNNFNKDFGTSFTSWDLKFFNWSLSDPIDYNYTDTYNPDPNIISINDYSFGGMMPTSGSHYKEGGFDPPRKMLANGESAFNDLWYKFRQTLVYHFVKDMATIARDRGFIKEQYYTHQIPAEYLWGSNPNDPNTVFNARYYSSASPLWTAKVYNDMGVGVTSYDINFITHYSRTSEYLIPDISSISSNWGLMEYNPEIIPSGNLNDINTVDVIYQQIKRLYNYNVHVINFFKWIGLAKYQIKGNNRETAIKEFFDSIKDKARQPISTVFSPKKVESFTGNVKLETHTIDLSWSANIWTNLPYKWEHWGDFKEFVLYRGYSEDFQANSNTELSRVNTYAFKDTNFVHLSVVYYKIAAVNTKGQRGSLTTIEVNTNTSGNNVLEVSRSALNYAANTNGTTTKSQSFYIQNTGTGNMNWTITDNVDWLTCTPISGINYGKVDVTVNPNGKTPGTYQGIITITAPNTTNSPHSINVTLKIYTSGADSAPFGSFDTPTQNSTVQSSIPVTGWAIDDIGLESIIIYRQSNNKLEEVGEAVMVEGARPDIETAYPTYPNNYKAGWGYMLLTNFLPNQGNGTYTLHAIARDVTGHKTTLGTKTIICDNAHAIKPFGAIDTPEQGGSASGSSFINWGWALTPQPNTIPTNGSTIDVYIDGVKIGHPVYNKFRSDIADYFPNYTNSNGSAGYYYIDTTKYSNGIHTLAWSVRDNAGNIDGIGSRYFSINNTGNDLKSYSQNSIQPSTTLVNNLLKLNQHTVYSSKPIEITKGYKTDTATDKIFPNSLGISSLTLNELERIRIQLKGNSNIKESKPYENRIIKDNWYGFQVYHSQLRPLPSGSSLDSINGIFYWQPGLAYLGEYRFVFFNEHAESVVEKKDIIIKITPKY